MLEPEHSLEQIADEALAAAVERYAGLAVERLGFVDYLQRRIAEGLDAEAARRHGAELVLGHVCETDKDWAARLLELHHMPTVPRAVLHMKLPPTALDEIRQVVRERLLLGDPPRLTVAVGGGTLDGLIKVMSVRLALNWLRDHAGNDEVVNDEREDPAADPAVAHMKRRYRSEIKEAFEAAAASLDARDRALLRFQFVEGLSIDQVAAVYGIHRATAARRLLRARDQLGVEARRFLVQRVRLSKDEMLSLAELVESQIDLSLSRVLATD